MIPWKKSTQSCRQQSTVQTDYYIKEFFFRFKYHRLDFIKHTKNPLDCSRGFLIYSFLRLNYDPQETQSSGLSIEQANCSSGVNSCTPEVSSTSATTGSI